MTAAAPPVVHIHLDERGIPWVSGTSFKVQQVVLDNQVHGWSAEEISYNHFGIVSVAQAHAALAYYHDNREAIDQQIESGFKESESLRIQIGETDIDRKLRAARRS